MGPPIFIGGNKTEYVLETVGGKASMGPPIFIGGNGNPMDTHSAKRRASMGPPIIIGGNTATVGWSRSGCRSLQWGRRFSSAEMRGL